MKWCAVISAGGLAPEGLSLDVGTPRKCLAPFGSETSLSLVLAAVRDAGLERVVTVAGPDVQPFVHYGQWSDEHHGQIESASRALDKAPDAEAILLLPADIPLVRASELAKFVKSVEIRLGTRSDPEKRWFAAGLCRSERFVAAFPDLELRTDVRMKEGSFLVGGLYACSPPAVRRGLQLLEQLSNSRASQLRMLWSLGPVSTLQYFWHRLRLSDAEKLLARLLGGEVALLPDSEPSAFADFDDAASYAALLRRYFAARV